MSVFDEIRMKVDLVEWIERDGVALRRSGGVAMGFCPFHVNQHTPAFAVYPDHYHCYSCHAHGSIFDYVMTKHGLTLREALEFLAPIVGVALPPRDQPEAEDFYELRETLRVAMTWYQMRLINEPSSAPVRHYCQERGITDDSRDRFQLGWAPPDGQSLSAYLRTRGFSESAMRAAGLLRVGPDGAFRDFFVGRLMFPILDQKERVIGFGGRTLQAHPNTPKYLNTPTTPLFKKGHVWYGLPFALPAIRKTGSVHVVEGYVDVVLAHQHGVTTAMAPLGSSVTAAQAALLPDRCETVFLVFDADAAGTLAMHQAAARLMARKQRPSRTIFVITLPPATDPAELLHRDPQAWEGACQAHRPYLDVVVDEITKTFDVKTIAGKNDALRAALPIIAVAPAMEQQLLARRMEDLTGVPVAHILAEATSHHRHLSPTADHDDAVVGNAQSVIAIRSPINQLLRGYWSDGRVAKVIDERIALWNATIPDFPVQSLKDLLVLVEERTLYTTWESAGKPAQVWTIDDPILHGLAMSVWHAPMPEQVDEWMRTCLVALHAAASDRIDQWKDHHLRCSPPKIQTVQNVLRGWMRIKTEVVP